MHTAHAGSARRKTFPPSFVSCPQVPCLCQYSPLKNVQESSKTTAETSQLFSLGRGSNVAQPNNIAAIQNAEGDVLVYLQLPHQILKETVIVNGTGITGRQELPAHYAMGSNGNSEKDFGIWWLEPDGSIPLAIGKPRRTGAVGKRIGFIDHYH